MCFTEPKGSVQPRITVEKHVTKQVKVGDDITLPCVAQGFPVPTYRYVCIYVEFVNNTNISRKLFCLDQNLNPVYLAWKYGWI